MFPGWRSPVKPGTDPPMFHVEHGQPCGPLATGCADSTRGRPRSPCARVALRTAADGLVVDGVTRTCRRARVQREMRRPACSGSGAGLRPTWHRQVKLLPGDRLRAEPDALRITMRLVLQRRNDGRTIEPSPAPFPAGATIRCTAPWWAIVVDVVPTARTAPPTCTRTPLASSAWLWPAPPASRAMGRSLRCVPSAVDRLPRAVHAWPHHLCGDHVP
jgi:hypothetical protein